jgi:hypothetical protein
MATRKRLADMASAFEDRALGQDRLQWAPSSRDLGLAGSRMALSGR